MEIYIEDFLIQNFLINFCLLKLVEVTTKSKTSIFRLVLSSILSAGFSVVSVIYIGNSFAMNISKLICSLLMVAIAFKNSKKSFVFNYILLFVFTYAIGGTITSICCNAYVTNFGTVITSNVNLSKITMCVIFLTYIIQFVAKKMKFKIKSNNYIFPIKIYFNNAILDLKAFLDTGNLLSYNNNPVLVLNSLTVLKMNSKIFVDSFKNSCFLQTNTVVGVKKLPIIQCEKVEIKINKAKKCFSNVYLALSQNFSASNYDALLSPYFF